MFEALCKRIVASLGENDVAWLAGHVSAPVGIVRRRGQPLETFADGAALERAIGAAGNIRSFLGIADDEPLRGSLRRDCERCERPYFSYWIAAPGITIEVRFNRAPPSSDLGWQIASIAAVRELP